MLKDRISKTSGWQFHRWLFGPETISGLSKNGPQAPEHNLVPRVLSLTRERTLVAAIAAGHVSMHANPSRTKGGSLTKILSKVRIRSI